MQLSTWRGFTNQTADLSLFIGVSRFSWHEHADHSPWSKSVVATSIAQAFPYRLNCCTPWHQSRTMSGRSWRTSLSSSLLFSIHRSPSKPSFWHFSLSRPSHVPSNCDIYNMKQMCASIPENTQLPATWNSKNGRFTAWFSLKKPPHFSRISTASGINQWPWTICWASPVCWASRTVAAAPCAAPTDSSWWHWLRGPRSCEWPLSAPVARCGG